MTIEQPEQVLAEVAQIISDLFGVEPESLTLETTRDSISGWDSLQHVNLILDVEQHFGIHLDETQAATILSVGDLVQAVQSVSKPQA